MPKVEFIYDTDCPHIKAARDQLLQAFAQAEFEPRWQEWARSNPESPAYVRGYGSPTILVDGKDVAGMEPSSGADCCRLYTDQSGQVKGVPSVEMITSALARVTNAAAQDTGTPERGGWRSSILSVPAIGAALLPALTCPACWPAYAGLLGSLGLGFIDYTPYLLPMTAFLSRAV